MPRRFLIVWGTAPKTLPAAACLNKPKTFSMQADAGDLSIS
jgi:hypothetical protein